MRNAPRTISHLQQVDDGIAAIELNGDAEARAA
jgi:hypothetical protein